jgi:hypothetical protein
LLILKQTVSFESKLALAKRIADPATQLFHFHHRRQQGVKIYTQCVTCSDCGTTITPDVLIWYVALQDMCRIDRTLKAI